MKKYIALSALAITLFGCGGGGGGSVTEQSANTNATEGIWSGSTKDKAGHMTDVLFVALETGELWGVQVTAATRSGGVMHGKIQPNNGSFSSTMRMYFSDKESITTWTTSGNYTSKATLNFTGDAPLQTTYNNAYASKASLSDLVGTYNSNVISKNNAESDVDISIDSKGKISGGDASSCFVIGQATPRTSGKNVFDVTLNAQGKDCPSGTSSTSGIGILLGNEFTVFTENAANNNVIGFSGNK